MEQSKSDRVIAGIALDEGRRMLDHQITALEGMRSRSVAVLAGATAASAFLGGIAAANGTPGWWMLVSGAAYLIALFLCLQIVRARPWESSLKVDGMVEHYRGQYDAGEAMWFLAENMQRSFDKQEKVLEMLGKWLDCQLACTVLMLFSWIGAAANV